MCFFGGRNNGRTHAVVPSYLLFSGYWTWLCYSTHCLTFITKGPHFYELVSELKEEVSLIIPNLYAHVCVTWDAPKRQSDLCECFFFIICIVSHSPNTSRVQGKSKKIWKWLCLLLSHERFHIRGEEYDSSATANLDLGKCIWVNICQNGGMEMQTIFCYIQHHTQLFPSRKYTAWEWAEFLSSP